MNESSASLSAGSLVTIVCFELGGLSSEPAAPVNDWTRDEESGTPVAHFRSARGVCFDSKLH